MKSRCLLNWCNLLKLQYKFYYRPCEKIGERSDIEVKILSGENHRSAAEIVTKGKTAVEKSLFKREIPTPLLV